MGLRQTLGHVVKRVDQETDLIPGRHWQPGIEIPLRHGPGPRNQLLNGRDQAPRREERAVDGQQQREQQHQAEGKREAGLQGVTKKGQLRILVVTGLHLFGKPAKLLIHPEDTLQDAGLGARRSGIQIYGGTDLKLSAAQRLEGNKRSSLAQLKDQLLGRVVWYRRRGIFGAGSQNLAVGTEHG